MAHAAQSFIADGFADDCDELMHRCLKEAPVTFKVFSKFFREMQISSLFHDRQSGAEIAELSEEVVNIAKYYMVANTGCYEESVVGLFLVYGLVNLQPFDEFAYLRIVEDDTPYIERIEQVARRDKRVDVLYILGKVLSEHTRYFAAVRERGMEPAYRKYLEGSTTAEVNLGLRPKGVFLRQNEEMDLIKEVAGIQIRYCSTKVGCKAGELAYTDLTLLFELETSLKNVMSGMIPQDTDDEEDEQERVRSIKDKAMKARVNPMRHLLGVQQRLSTQPSMPHTSDFKTATGKVKTGSPTKQVTTSKTKVKITPQRQKRKRSTRDETSEESEISLRLSDHDSDCADIDLDNFNKAPLSTTRSNPHAEDSEVEVDDRNIRMGALPCVITSEDNGKTYEIEIIDKLKQSINDTSDCTTRMEFALKCANSESKFRKEPMEKRDLKKTILKSRFKRMGIEPIANFKTT